LAGSARYFGKDVSAFGEPVGSEGPGSELSFGDSVGSEGAGRLLCCCSLSEEERMREIARMASGDDVTEAALANAREMLANAQKKQVEFRKKTVHRK